MSTSAISAKVQVAAFLLSADRLPPALEASPMNRCAALVGAGETPRSPSAPALEAFTYTDRLRDLAPRLNIFDPTLAFVAEQDSETPVQVPPTEESHEAEKQVLSKDPVPSNEHLGFLIAHDLIVRSMTTSINEETFAVNGHDLSEDAIHAHERLNSIKRPLHHEALPRENFHVQVRKVTVLHKILHFFRKG